MLDHGHTRRCLSASASWLKALMLVLGLLPALACGHPPLKDGDLVFQMSRSSQSLAVQRATSSPWSHMGIIMMRGQQPVVLEAAGRVRYTPWKSWVKRGQGGRLVVKRLRDAQHMLTPEATRRLHAEGHRLLGRPYDLTFAWSDERVYCSELVWKMYERALRIRIGELQTMGDFKLDHPVVRKKLRERYGSTLPLDEPVISPAAMYASERLVTVFRR